MPALSKTHQKATDLAGAPVEGLFMASRVNPMLAFALSALIALSVASGELVVQLFALLPFLMVIWLTVGRWVGVTRDEIVIYSGRPPLFRPAKVVTRLPREPLPVQKTRLYWKMVLSGQQHWVNKAFVDQVQLIADAPLDGARGRSTTASERAVARDQRSSARRIDSKRITPKGSRNRKPKKYR